MYRMPAMPYMPMMTMPYDMDMDNDDLVVMYPKLYYKIHPLICNCCDRLEHKYGVMCSPSKEELDEMCEEMYEEIKDDLEDLEEDECEHNHCKCSRGSEEGGNDTRRRRRYGRRRAFRDFLGIMLVGELLGRRRRRFYGGYPRPYPRPQYGYGYGPGGYY